MLNLLRQLNIDKQDLIFDLAFLQFLMKNLIHNQSYPIMLVAKRKKLPFLFIRINSKFTCGRNASHNRIPPGVRSSIDQICSKKSVGTRHKAPSICRF
jgi:hypothetical protein